MQLQHGSGKTAVLVERIINKIINENVDIDKLLVVTFTNAAASEMKQRVLDAIYKKLDENPENENLQRQLLLLNKASICTIDSFCLDIVKNNFYQLENVSPNFRIADTTEIDILEQETLEEIFENKYEQEDESFLKLIHTYTNYKDDTPLKELILKIFKAISSMPFPDLWLKEHIEMFNLKEELDKDFSETPWGKILLNDIEDELIDDIKVLENLKEQSSKFDDFDKVLETLEYDINVLQTIKANLDSWDKTYYCFINSSFKRWVAPKSSNPFKDEAKTIRDSVKTKYKTKLEKILINDSKQSNLDIYDMYKTLVNLQDLIKEFEEEFAKKKQEKNIVDFSDIEHFALNILLKYNEDGNLEKTDVAKMYSQKFEEIAIDEYQDSNMVQEYIMTAISRGNNIYMVGDVKQSIYKFRQAMPKLFLDKYDSYKLKNNIDETDKNLKIQLFKNFRSRKNILDFTNLIFQDIMSKKLGDVEYTEEEYLNLGAHDYKDSNQNLKTELMLINLNEEKSIETEDISEIEDVEEHYEDIELEAKLVSNRIKQLIDTKFQVYDRKKECFRNIKYSDIAILLRSTKNKANIFEQEIIDTGMPVFSDISQEYLDSIEIQTIISLLKIIDNPIQDIPLVTVMRSNIGKFTDDDLVKIRLNDKYDNFYTCLIKAKPNVDDDLKEKIQKFLDNLKMWRKEQEYLALDELIWKIYSDTGYYNYVGLMPNGALRQANLKALFERAKLYESASFKGLYNFINFIDKLKLGSGDMNSAKLIGENDDVIRIMSIHKSKGLEFPVVILANTGKQFNKQSIKSDQILLHNELGIGMKYINHDMQIEYNTNAKIAVKNLLEIENISEEMRVLYVALTRAKEKLIITGLCKDYEKIYLELSKQVGIYKKQNEKINPILLKKCNSYLEWILLSNCYDEEKFKNLADIKIVLPKDIINTQNIETNNSVDLVSILDNKDFDQKEVDKIKEQIEFEYKYKISTVTPTKTSVSEIKRKYLEDEGESLINNSVNVSLAKPNFLRNEENLKLSGAQKGTLMHMCLQRLDSNVDYSKEKIQEMIEDMYSKHIITNMEKDAINQYKILQFTKSKIWQEMKQAKKVFKEKPFYIEINANEINKENDEDSILVQGIIDLYYIDQNDEIVLVDYKTDFVENRK